MRFWLCRMFFWLWLGLVRQWFLLQRCVCHRFGGWNICVCGWCGCVSWYGGDGWCGVASWFCGGSWFGGTVELNLKCFWLILLVILLRQNLVRLTGRPSLWFRNKDLNIIIIIFSFYLEISTPTYNIPHFKSPSKFMNCWVMDAKPQKTSSNRNLKRIYFSSLFIFTM